MNSILTIIIPTFNSSATISRAIKSIIEQDFTHWELLIMDGQSTDSTIQIAKSFHAPRIHIFSEHDKGIYDAMNKGIKKASGDWLYFLGSDDWLLSTHTLSDVFSNSITQYDVIYGDVEAPHLPPEHKGEWTIQSIDFNRCHQAIFYRKDVFKKIGVYSLEYPVLADHDLNLRWYFNSKIKKKYLPLPIAHYSSGGYSEKVADSMFYKYLPYLKLKYGWNSYTKEERTSLINEAQKRKCKKHPFRWFDTEAMYIRNILDV